ncbi:amino acid efflux permease RhtB family protein [Shewanella algicola]|uniref:LysE family translocator n=1 Tax=Shewanella algicola TaxID=640633 RepID=A0A9X1Z7T6_9GAMM|nr:LysE family translocator [Shewanella algicola]MCL1106819.1 LysE family translocator [Shewanella algicola]GGP62975.1 amino acid efflux permease RhtB family protein [Shewanella algicola]
MTFSAWLGLLAICCLGAMSPGPSLAMVVRHTLSGGRLHGVVCAWAHSIGIGVYALVTLLGLAAVLKASPMIFNAIAVVGALYLAWIGIQSLRSKGGMQQKLAAGKPSRLWEAARDGIAISLFNPKILLFFLALFSQFVLAAQTTVGQGLIVFTPLVVDGLWYTIIAFVLSHASVLPRLREKSQLIDRLSGVVLILLAMRVIYSLL